MESGRQNQTINREYRKGFKIMPRSDEHKLRIQEIRKIINDALDTAEQSDDPNKPTVILNHDTEIILLTIYNG